jgi:hypothetical protein
MAQSVALVSWSKATRKPLSTIFVLLDSRHPQPQAARRLQYWWKDVASSFRVIGFNLDFLMGTLRCGWQAQIGAACSYHTLS